MSLAQALQNKTITRLVIVPERLDVAAELEGLPAKFSLDRCDLGQTCAGCCGCYNPFKHTFSCWAAGHTGSRTGRCHLPSRPFPHAGRGASSQHDTAF